MNLKITIVSALATMVFYIAITNLQFSQQPEQLCSGFTGIKRMFKGSGEVVTTKWVATCSDGSVGYVSLDK